MSKQRQYRALVSGLGDIKRFAYGSHCVVAGKDYIILDDAGMHRCHESSLDYEDEDYIDGFVEVIPDSVGQATGMKDKRGQPVYEGDEIDVHGIIYVVRISDTLCVWFEAESNSLDLEDIEDCIFEVIGHVHKEQ